jgi:hypothetical protein
MPTERLPANDPRTLARDIPGLFDALFPQLVPGVVAHFNRKSSSVHGCDPVKQELVTASGLQRAMLFEIAVAAAEQLLERTEVDWKTCLEVAVERQRRHFDAKLPGALSDPDRIVALQVATNLRTMLRHIQADPESGALIRSPHIPGYQWVASGVGDFSIGTRLIEVKCTRKHFSSSDYRQIMMYWLLSYAASVERGTPEWSEGVLVNPRLNLMVILTFDEVIRVIAAGRSKVELLELFVAMIGDRTFHMAMSIR